MVDKEKFLKAMVYLFYSKGKDKPAGKLVEVWYNELKDYDEAKVMNAFKQVSKEQTYGIQVADIVKIVDPPRDYEDEALEAYNFMLLEISLTGTIPSSYRKKGYVTSSLIYDIKYSTSDYVKSQAKRDFIKQYTKIEKGVKMEITEKKQHEKIDSKVDDLINESIPNKT